MSAPEELIGAAESAGRTLRPAALTFPPPAAFVTIGVPAACLHGDPRRMTTPTARCHWSDYPVYLVVRLLICLVQALPLSACQRGCRLLARLFADVLRVRRCTVEENLSGAFPDWSAAERARLARQMWEHLFLMVCELAHAPRKIGETSWRRHICLCDQRPIVRSLLVDRPVVIVSGHYGNFELSNYVLGLLGFPAYAIARPLDNRFLDRFVNRFRGARGQRILPKNGSAAAIDAVLSSGGTLTLLADQHAGPKGQWVEFFGRPASTHKAIAVFSLASDAPLLVCYDRREGKILQHQIGLAGIADPRNASAGLTTVPALTEWYTRRLEEIVRQAPEQYWWLHRRWRERPARPSNPRREAA